MSIASQAQKAPGNTLRSNKINVDRVGMIHTRIVVVRLISFGYLHLPTTATGLPIPPEADRVEDVRHTLHDLAAARDIIALTGHHPLVQRVVLRTPGARELLADLTAYALRPAPRPRTIAIGCAGGKHRACALVVLLTQTLRSAGLTVDAQHLHAHLPRVLTAS